MSDDFGLRLVPSPMREYERLNTEIEALRPHVTEGSTSLFDLNRMVVRRRQIWMRMNGLGTL